MALIGRGRLRLLPLAATVQPKVSSPALRAFLAETRNPGLHRPPLRFGPPPIRQAEWGPECVHRFKLLPEISHRGRE